jgi:hypothetical protein
MSLPNGWKKAPLSCGQSPYDILLLVEGDPFFRLIGMSSVDTEYSIYEIPKATKLSEIVLYFRIGSHNAFVYGSEEGELVRQFENIVSEFEKIIGCTPVFADSAGLKLIFQKGITESEIVKLSNLFSEENALRMGIENYFLEWDGQSPMLERVKEEGYIHFWWD